MPQPLGHRSESSVTAPHRSSIEEEALTENETNALETSGHALFFFMIVEEGRR